jgi:hypothetical protein
MLSDRAIAETQFFQASSARKLTFFGSVTKLESAVGAVADHDELLYRRNSTGSEIDFVGRRLGGVAVESKYVDDDRWGRTAQIFRSSPWRGIVASRSVTQWEDTLSVIPTCLLVLLLGT